MTKTLAPPPAFAGDSASDKHPSGLPPHRRRRGGGATPRRRRPGPSTPLLRWKLDDQEGGSGLEVSPLEDPLPRRKKRVPAAGQVASARRLAAAVWRRQEKEAGTNFVGGGGRARTGTEYITGHLQGPSVCKPNSESLHAKKDEFSSPIYHKYLEYGLPNKLESTSKLSNYAMEGATKWDPHVSKELDEVQHFYGNMNTFEDHQTSSSIISALQSELEVARFRISELEVERRSAKKKLDNFLKKLAEEKALWRNREHEKIREIMSDIKADLTRERKNRKWMETVNSKLVNELSEAKLSAKRFLQDYEKERKARGLMEEVCDELAKEIGDDKAEVEALRRESTKIREEVEEERKMLQMAEVWREERVQMKLIDAKLTLDEKYSQLSKLYADLEAFLKSQNKSNQRSMETREAELLRDAVNSVSIHDINEFVYHPPPASEDIYSIFEELQPRDNDNEKEIEQCDYSPTSHSSRIHTSPDINDFLEKPSMLPANKIIIQNGEIEDDSGWETASHIEEHETSNSLGSDPSVNCNCKGSNHSVSGTDWEENGDNVRENSDASEVCSIATKQSRKKTSSIARFWRSCPSNGENYQKISIDLSNGRLSNGRISNAKLSPERRSCDQSLEQWRSPDSMNALVTRGMKGCIEWPRGIQKHSLKAKLLEARMESQKIQLRQVLKQKI